MNQACLQTGARDPGSRKSLSLFMRGKRMPAVAATFAVMLLPLSSEARTDPAAGPALDRDPAAEERPAALPSTACPTQAMLRIPAATTLERYVSLRGCRDRTIVAPPGEPAVRLQPVIIPGSAEHAGETGPSQGRGSTGPDDESRSPARVQPSQQALAWQTGMVRIVPSAAEFEPGRAGGAMRAAMFAPASGMAAPRDFLDSDTIFALAPRSYRTAYDRLIAEAARRHGVDPLLLHAVIRQESNYGAGARSRAGAIGLMQIMPATGARFGQRGSQLYDPARNVETGARLLRRLHALYEGDFDLMLSAYNAGEGAVARYGTSVPPFRETRDYVARVKAHYTSLAAENGHRGLRF